MSWIRAKMHQRTYSYSSIVAIVRKAATFLIGSFSTSPFMRIKLLLLMLFLVASTFKYHVGFVMNTEQVVRTKPLMLDSIEKVLQQRATFTFGTAAEVDIINSSNDPIVSNIMSYSHTPFLGPWMDPSIGRPALADLLDMKHAVIVKDRFPHEDVLCALSMITDIDISQHRFLKVQLYQVSSPLVGIIMSKKLYETNRNVANILAKSVRITSLESQIGDAYFLRLNRQFSDDSVFGDRLRICRRSFQKENPIPILFQPSAKTYKWLLVIVSCLYAAAFGIRLVEGKFMICGRMIGASMRTGFLWLIIKITRACSAIRRKIKMRRNHIRRRTKQRVQSSHNTSVVEAVRHQQR
jgi:hypothetical protein